MISENISRPKLPGPYTIYPPIINTIVPSTSSTYQYSSRIYFLSKKLNLCKERMTYKYWYGMGSDLFLKTLRNSIMTYIFKTKIILQQFNPQNSSTFEWREVISHINNSYAFEWGEVSIGNVQDYLNDDSSNIQRLWYTFLQYGEWQKIHKYIHGGTASCTAYYLLFYYDK